MSTKGSPNRDGPERGGNPTQSPSVKHICVYLAGNIGTREEHVRQAETLGRLMATEGIGLVYGGARVGLMGALADAVLAHGGSVTGVILFRFSWKMTVLKIRYTQ